jgi:glycosyltransferase involved in cell wall biosynthesis
MDTPRVCFVALRAYGLLSARSDIKHQGGAERQQLLLARELVRGGYSVSFITLDHGQPDGERLDTGIRVFKAYRLDEGVRGVRFVYPRLAKLWAAMSRADAEIYYQRGAEAETGLVASWCARRDRRFIFAAAHDTNFLPALEMLGSFHERALYRYGLRRADRIVVQTEQQLRLLREGFALDATIVRNCWSPPEEPKAIASQRLDDPVMVLWVGRLSQEKRPEWLVALARDRPETHFEVVGHANTASPLATGIANALRSLPNVTWHGFLSHDRLQEVYSRATFLVCTSKSEGFPNVFLEAWGQGVATVSTVDPDGLIKAHGLGSVASRYEDLLRLVDQACADPAQWRERGREAADYVRANHAPAASARAFKLLLRELAAIGGKDAPVAI